MRRVGGLVVLAVVFALTLVVFETVSYWSSAQAQSRSTTSASTNGTRGAKPYTTWTAYGGGAPSSQFSALDQINKSNVSQLDVAWTFPVAGTVIFNPLVVDGVMYLTPQNNTIAAVDARRGDSSVAEPARCDDFVGKPSRAPFQSTSGRAEPAAPHFTATFS